MTLVGGVTSIPTAHALSNKVRQSMAAHVAMPNRAAYDASSRTNSVRQIIDAVVYDNMGRKHRTEAMIKGTLVNIRA